MKFQFNKTAMQRLKRELKVREQALPTLKAKETALRLEVGKATDRLHQMEQEQRALESSRSEMMSLWLEYPAVLSIDEIELRYRNIAGVRVPEVEHVGFVVREYSLYANRAWVPGGTEFLKEYCMSIVRLRLMRVAIRLLARARKKTTQKVNLYEKVQIPEYHEALRRIKRFLEDQENLSSSAQKIVKARNAAREAQAM